MPDSPLMSITRVFAHRFYSSVLLWTVLSGSAAAGDPAWPGHHPLTQSQVGDLLIAEFRCAACHTGLPQGAVPEKVAPDLTQVGARVAPDYLQQYLAAPATVHPGTTMPDVLASVPEPDRNQIAAALTHFLVSQTQPRFQAATSEPTDREQGKLLFHTVGCVACHRPREAPPEIKTRIDAEEDDDDPAVIAKKTIQPVALPLDHVAAKYSISSLSEFLFQPLRVRASGRMPDMKLTPAESRAIAVYLVGERPRPQLPFALDEALVTQGRKHFQELNCVACHALPGFTASQQIGDLKSADLSRGCLSAADGRHPRFHLTPPQVQAIAATLRETPQADPDHVVVAKTLTAFRCLTCHVRDNYGGVHDSQNPYFAGSELKLGDDGRIPPPLTLIGAKLQPAWLKKVLFDGESVRHYMATRMPQYGVSNLQHLPEVFARLDVVNGPELKLPQGESRVPAEREREKLLRAAGRELLGDKGLNCIACHNFNGKAAHLNEGIDLLTSYPRLQSGWFNLYLRNPGEFRPRTVMPTGWPNGVASHKTILDGDTDQQITAIWYYLSLGTSAADPPGLRPVNTKLVVEDRARIHRGRSRVAGFRGIAVGLPEQMHYAFNAETGTLSALWQGEFIGVNWSGQGSGDFQPASEPITLAQDVSFAQLTDENTPWPRLPVMTKEARTNPDPLYPKNVGYQFRGYVLDEWMIPTFLYRTGTVEIADRITAAGTTETRTYRRMLQVDTPTAQTVWFRALTGDIRQESETVYRNGRLRLTIPPTTAQLRPLPDNPQQSELLLRLPLPQGQSTLEFLYAPLPR